MRVFILGAGVSKSYGGPLTAELLPEAMERVRTKSGYVRLIKRIDEILAYAFPTYNPSQCIYPDIETILSMLEVWKEFNSDIQKEPKYSDFAIEEVRRWILRVITERLIPLSDNITNDSAISKFAASLRAGDVVITFNWDLGLEKALELVTEFEWEYFWYPKLRNRITLLKAHGSIDWFRTEDFYQVPKRWHEPLGQTTGRISVLRWWDFREIIPRRPKEITPYIIPPTHTKSFQDEEMRKIWRNMSEVLVQAESIYIFGYSLPDADPQAQIILRSGIEQNKNLKKVGEDNIVFVVNPAPNVKSRFDGLGLRYHFILRKFKAIDFSQLPG